MMSSLVSLAQQTEEQVVNELPMPAPMYGIVCFGLLMLLLLITMGYRNVHTRHR